MKKFFVYAKMTDNSVTGFECYAENEEGAERCIMSVYGAVEAKAFSYKKHLEWSVLK